MRVPSKAANSIANAVAAGVRQRVRPHHGVVAVARRPADDLTTRDGCAAQPTRDGRTAQPTRDGRAAALTLVSKMV